MRFTVIIATCGRPDRLSAALAAVEAAAAAHAQDDALVVADNGPEDSARGAVQAFARRASLGVTYLRSKPFSKAAALNAGIAAAATDWLAFTDDDCLPDRDWLAAAGRYAAAGGFNLFSGRLESVAPEFPLPRWLAGGRAAPLDWNPAFVDFAPLPASGELADGDRVPFGANIFVRKRIFERHGGYDEALWDRCGRAALGCEDAEFAMRVRARGEAIGYCHEALVRHPVYRERTTRKYYLRHIFHAGVREPFFAEQGRRASVPFLCKHAARSLAYAGGHRFKRRHAHAMKALMSAARDLGELWGWARTGGRGA